MKIHHSPLRYPGGKNCVFPFVSNLIYENGLIGTSYAEPYAGGSGLALRLLFSGYVNEIYINDLDKLIYTFWKIVLESPRRFCEWIRHEEVTIHSWHKYKEIQENYTQADDYEIAKSTFFLNRTNISGVLKGGVIGGKDQKGKYKIDARFNKEDLIERIQKIRSYKNKIHVTNIDGVTFAKKINKADKNIFIYLDPPYLQKGSDLYLNFYKKSDHKKVAKQVQKIDGNWIVSYDNHPLIHDLYSGCNRIIHKLSQSASNRVGDEVIIFSKEIEFETSMSSLKSATIVS